MKYVTRLVLVGLAALGLMVASFAATGTVLAGSDAQTRLLDGNATTVSATTAKCPSGSNKLSSYNYSVIRGDGSQLTLQHLGGAVREGDQIQVNFTVKAGCTNVQMSLAAYSAPAPYYDRNTADQQILSDSQSGTFNAGSYSLTVNVPSCYFQVDFVRGAVITQLGPANTHNFYGDQGRLVDHDNGGTVTCGPQ